MVAGSRVMLGVVGGEGDGSGGADDLVAVRVAGCSADVDGAGLYLSD